MSYHYSDKTREENEYALPDVEVFYHDPYKGNDAPHVFCDEPGFYYWFCFPGCTPHSEPFGPFDTEAEALADAREEY